MAKRVLAQLNLKQLNTGVFLNMPDEHVPLFKDGLNVVFREDGPQPIKGFTQIAYRSSTEPIRGMIQTFLPQDGNPYIFFGTTTGLYWWKDGDMTPTRVGSGFNATWWSFARWGNWIFAANGEDNLQVWKGSGDFVDLTAETDFSIEEGGELKPNVIVTYQNMLVAFSTDSAGGEPQRIRACSPDNHLDWKPAVDNQAVELIARDLFSSVRAATVTSQGVFFFGRTSAHKLNYLGPPYVLGQEKVLEQVGVWGPNALANVNDQVFAIGPNGVFSLSLGGAQEQRPEQADTGLTYVDQPAVRQYIRENLDRRAAETCCLLFDVQQDVVIVGFPAMGYNLPSEGLALSLDTGAWCPVDFAPSGAAPAEVFDHASAGDRRGRIFWHGVQAPMGQQSPPGARSYLPFFSEPRVLSAGYGIMGYGSSLYGYGI